MKRLVIAATVGAALLTHAAPALSAGVLKDFILKWQDDPKVNCANQDTTYAGNVCAGRAYKKTYTALVKVYGELAAKYDPANRKLLEASQAAWERYADQECAYETAGTVGGTIHSSMVTNCNDTLATARLKQLTAQLKCEEGDMSCNAP